jgi:uncharacterized protein YoaH (UPF0181 family)
MNEAHMQEEVPVDDSVEVRTKAPSKMEQKRQQIFIDRIRRHMAAGMTQEQAVAAIAKEDYERLPVDAKLARIEKVFSNAHAGLANDLNQVHANQVDLADTMDVNFRAFGKMLERLGLKPEDQKACFDAAAAEINAEQAAAKKEHLQASIDTGGDEAPAVPEGATVQG